MLNKPRVRYVSRQLLSYLYIFWWHCGFTNFTNVLVVNLFSCRCIFGRDLMELHEVGCGGGIWP